MDLKPHLEKPSITLDLKQPVRVPIPRIKDKKYIKQ